MRLLISIIFIQLFLCSCKKQKTFDFPVGDWQIIHYLPVTNCNCFYIDSNNYLSNTSFCKDCAYHKFKHSYPIEGASLNSNSTRLLFYYKNKVEKLVISNLKNINGWYKLKLKSKSKKSFNFDYKLINDSIIIGDFLLPDFNYYTSFAPAIGKYYADYLSSDGKFINVQAEFVEVLAVFKKNK